MASILVAGGYPDSISPEDPIRIFARALATQVIRQGHRLLGGCQTELDAEVASAAKKAAEAAGKSVADCVVSYVGKETKPIHSIGSVRRSELLRWDLIGTRLTFPEPIAQADAIILIGGWEGTRRAANWARLAERPILPIATFGLGAAEIYQTELDQFKPRYGSRIKRSDYELLNSVFSDYRDETMSAFAERVVSLAERIISPRQVFVIMSFADDPALEDAYDTFKSACEAKQFKAFRVDEHIDPSSQRIVPEILEAIEQSAFVVADVSEPKPNVYYELGWAQALGKPVIVTAREGTSLPFDIHDVPTLYWKNQKTLRELLKSKIEKIAQKAGR